MYALVSSLTGADHMLSGCAAAIWSRERERQASGELREAVTQRPFMQRRRRQPRLRVHCRPLPDLVFKFRSVTSM